MDNLNLLADIVEFIDENTKHQLIEEIQLSKDFNGYFDDINVVDTDENCEIVNLCDDVENDGSKNIIPNNDVSDKPSTIIECEKKVPIINCLYQK